MCFAFDTAFGRESKHGWKEDNESCCGGSGSQEAFKGSIDIIYIHVYIYIRMFYLYSTYQNITKGMLYV